MGSRGYNAAALGFKSVIKDPAPASTVFFGVELEVEYTGAGGYDVGRQHVDQYEAVEKLFGDFIITKSDGSLQCGMELNTSPGTMGFHKLFNWKGVLQGLTAAGFKAQATCGMHVHVSRAPLGETRVARLCKFIYNPDNFAFIRYIAGRHSDRWAQIKNIGTSPGFNNAPAQYVRSYGKYMALNLSPSNTIEFRMFASTLQPHRFLSRLEFVAALVEFSGLSEEAAMKLKAVSPYTDAQAFMDWVLTKGKKYPNLFRKVKKFRCEKEEVQTLGYKPRGVRGFRVRASSRYAPI